MGVRFAGCETEDELWSILQHGTCTVSSLASHAGQRVWNTQRPIKHGGVLKDVKGFDAALFNISHREAMSMDPQQRIMLETCYRALENAGLTLEDARAVRTGVMIGSGVNEYHKAHEAHCHVQVRCAQQHAHAQNHW